MRVAWVVPRYGPEIGGGAEELCRRLVELLRNDVESVVLTTCALDYRTWRNHYPAGEATFDGVPVLRFPVTEPRDVRAFDALSREAFARPDDRDLAERWMRAQGPNAPALVDHLASHGRDYDVVCFMPYLYATTADSIRVVSDRALLQPCAHDESPLRLTLYDEIFSAARVLVFNAPEERALIESRFGGDERPRFEIGLAVDEPPPSDPDRFRRNYGIDGRYLLCLGRLEPSKGTDEAVSLFEETRRRYPDVSLVLMGRPHMDTPEAPGLVVTGFVDEQTKHDGLAGAEVVVLPSQYESLSIAALEAWSHGRPTLANARSEVLRGQSVRSNGGLWYSDPAEFHEALELLLEHPPLAETLGLQGRRWLRASGGWPRVRELWRQALDAVTSPPAHASHVATSVPGRARGLHGGDRGTQSLSAAYDAFWRPSNEAEARGLILNETDPELFETSGRKQAEKLCRLVSRDDTVLDLGCGIGRVARYVAASCRMLWAVDASETMLDLARERLADLPNVGFARCAGTTIPSLAAGTIDMAYSILTLQHLEREDAFELLREVRRVLCTGGTAYFTFPNLLSDEYLAAFVSYVERGAVKDHSRARFYTPEEVQRLLPAAGFELIDLVRGVEIEAICRAATQATSFTPSSSGFPPTVQRST